MAMPDSAPPPVLTLDGPSGSGKGTIGQLLAGRLGWHFLDSGALYRAVGYLARRHGIDAGDAETVADLAARTDIRFAPQHGALAGVIANGEQIGPEIRTEESGEWASRVAALPAVRRALLQKQRDFRQSPGLVADGRDMGTTVFPGAVLKIFLTASPAMRAQRRYKQLKEKGFDVNLARLVGEIEERDARDAAREASPLMPADDACVLDTSNMSIAEVVHHVLALLHERLGQQA